MTCALRIGKLVATSLTFSGGASSCQRAMQEIEKEFMKHALKALEISTNVVNEDRIMSQRTMQQQQQQQQ